MKKIHTIADNAQHIPPHNHSVCLEETICFFGLEPIQILHKERKKQPKIVKSNPTTTQTNWTCETVSEMDARIHTTSQYCVQKYSRGDNSKTADFTISTKFLPPLCFHPPLAFVYHNTIPSLRRLQNDKLHI